MTFTAIGPRVLLRRLREVMAEQGTAQEKLDHIAHLVAANVVAEVCSIYVLNDEGELELYATEGLKPESVHRVRLRPGEGLVGTIAETAETLNLSDAQAHPAFKYFPETGEEIYASFLGVPILRGGRVTGVLTVQNRRPRHYTEEEEEALQTTAMVLAEFFASPEFRAEYERRGERRSRRLHLRGEALHPGVALGHVVLHQPRVVIRNFVADNIETEIERLHEALQTLRTQVNDLIATTGLAAHGEHAEIFETVRMFAHDRGWVRRIEEGIRRGLSAEAAVERVQSDNRARMLRQTDPYMRERMHDLDDLANRLLRILTGQVGTAAQGKLPKDAVIVARNMGPAELLDYDRERLRGLVLEEGGTGSHVAIVARALEVPTIGQVEGITDLVENGDAIILDGRTGDVHVRPTPEIEQAYVEKVRLYARRQERFARLRHKPAITQDGVRVSLNINAGLLVDLPHLEDSGADGIGLYRTELQFMLTRTLPRREEQEKHYRAVLEAAGDKPVVFRTLDVGSDKVLPYMQTEREENPAMGWRALRMGLDRPGLLKMQLRALLAAASGRVLNVMFPMVTDVGEFLAARSYVVQQIEAMRKTNRALPKRVRIGAMVEVPALFFQLDELLRHADFISVGSNDLHQFLFAADRTHPRMAHRYDPLHPAMIRLLDQMAKKTRARGVPLSLCGEMAGNPLDAMILIALGFTSLSMAPAAIGPVKAMVRSLNRADLARRIPVWLAEGRESLRERAAIYAREHGVVLYSR
ncbi:phosphoenolpyruvate--protein phosphotransferase [Thermopetrobacter sp. TC1]|uniref:phosphoenolpyruvate--protein phosphotransferase n=1 Tax=Thermopetrobacter sp. TC1 TaxID=1495045 RepID=UPI0005719E7E|nr:phosphoenolpyruvate--protein phosphotransferase [Thermopetrobacter sp. TC1]